MCSAEKICHCIFEGELFNGHLGVTYMHEFVEMLDGERSSQACLDAVLAGEYALCLSVSHHDAEAG